MDANARYDVVVIGAGPAGSAAACFLARAGVRVALLDKATFPRDKTCGDAISYRAMQVIEDMGALAAVRAVAQPVQRVRFIAPDGHPVVGTLPPHSHYDSILVVPRLQLDALLKDCAVQAGAILLEGQPVDGYTAEAEGVAVHTAGGEQTHARLVLVATGASSALLRRQGILPRQPQTMLAARGYAHRLQADPHEILFNYDRMALPAYGWIFPLPQGRANVGAGFYRVGPFRRRMPATARQSLAEYLENPQVQAALGGQVALDEIKSYPLRVDFLHAPKTAPRTLILGEAAGLVNPLTGEGIDYALESGALAAEHAAAMLAADDFGGARLSKYARALQARFSRDFRYHTFFRDTLFTYPALLNRVLALAGRDPAFMHHLLNAALGILDPAKILAPRFLLRLAFNR